jgi:hypothetical protein
MTKHKKGFYYYLIWVLALINVPLSFAALASLKLAYLNEQLISDYGTSCRAVFIIVLQIWYIREIFQLSNGIGMKLLKRGASNL